MNFNDFITKMKRQESPFYSFLYKYAKAIRSFSVPTLYPLHNFLYREWDIRTNLWHNFWRIMYYEPIFKSQCKKVGKGFYMGYCGNGTTRINGNLQLYLGSNVSIQDNTMLTGMRIFDKPELHVGDNTYLGAGVFINVAKKISIGKHCLIGSKLLADNTGHPLQDVIARMKPGGGAAERASVRPIIIGDFCLVGLDTVVYPGVNIGDGAVAIIGTHITRDVPPFCLVSGNPMKIRMKLPIPPEIADIVGEERYQGYLECHKKVKIRR